MRVPNKVKTYFSIFFAPVYVYLDFMRITLTNYNFKEFIELDDKNKVEYLFKYLDDIQSKLYFTYREIIRDEPEKDELTPKKKLKLLDCLNHELNYNLKERIQNRFNSSGLNPIYNEYISFEVNTRDFIKDKFEQILNRNFERFFTGESLINIDTNLLEREILEHHTFWPFTKLKQPTN